MTVIIRPTIVTALLSVRLGVGVNVPVEFRHLQRNNQVLQCLNPVKVGEHVIRSELDRGRFLELWPSVGDNQSDVESFPGRWHLLREEIKVANSCAFSICLYFWDELNFACEGSLANSSENFSFYCVRLVAPPAHTPASLDTRIFDTYNSH